MKDKKNKEKDNYKYLVSYVSKYGGVIDTTYHMSAKELGTDVAWLASHGYEIKKVKKLK